jgi:uncharacterized iron-regulated membrane protein
MRIVTLIVLVIIGFLIVLGTFVGFFTWKIRRQAAEQKRSGWSS